MPLGMGAFLSGTDWEIPRNTSNACVQLAR